MSTEFRIRLAEGEVIISRRFIPEEGQMITTQNSSQSSKGVTLGNSQEETIEAEEEDDIAAGEADSADSGGGTPGVVKSCAGIVVVFGSVNMCGCGSDLGSGEGDSADSGGQKKKKNR